MTFLPRTAYTTDENIIAMVTRYAKVGVIREQYVEALAVAVHKVTPWAGRPIPWEDMSETYREHRRAEARAHLLEAIDAT